MLVKNRVTCVVSDRYRFLVFLIAKNASTTIRTELRKEEYGTKEIIGGPLNSKQLQYRKYAFLRDPVDRFLAGYHEVYIRHQGQQKHFKEMGIDKPLSYEFLKMEDSVQNIDTFLGHIQERRFFDVHIKKQIRYIESFNVDEYYTIDKLYDGIYSIREYCGLDPGDFQVNHLRKRRLHRNKKNYSYSKDEIPSSILQKIIDIYREDIELYNAVISQSLND